MVIQDNTAKDVKELSPTTTVKQEEVDKAVDNRCKNQGFPPGTLRKRKNGNFRHHLTGYKFMNIVEWKGDMYAHIWNKQPKCMSLIWDELRAITEKKDKIEAAAKLVSVINVQQLF